MKTRSQGWRKRKGKKSANHDHLEKELAEGGAPYTLRRREGERELNPDDRDPLIAQRINSYRKKADRRLRERRPQGLENGKKFKREWNAT